MVEVEGKEVPFLVYQELRLLLKRPSTSSINYVAAKYKDYMREVKTLKLIEHDTKKYNSDDPYEIFGGEKQ